MQDISSIVKHLLKYGFVIFNCPLVATHADDIFTDFETLLSQDEEFKERWKFFFPELTKKPDHGLIPPKGIGHDQKWFLMVRKTLKSMLLDENNTKRLREEEFSPYVDFFKQLDLVHSHLLLQARSIGKEIDTQFPGFGVEEQLYDQKVEGNHVIRLVQYMYQQDAPTSNPMASLHTDQCFLTMQWYQSDPGLIIKDYTNRTHAYDYQPGRVICFFGKKVLPVFNNAFKPVEHWVDSRAKRNRNSGIFFIHTAHPNIEMDKY